MTTTDQPVTSPARQLAEQLRALSAHLDDNDHLAPVWTQSGEARFKCQLHGQADSAAALIAWAETMPTVERIYAKVIKDVAYVYVHGCLSDWTPVEVWDTVPGLAESRGWDAATRVDVIALDVLRDFAAEGARVIEVEEAREQALVVQRTRAVQASVIASRCRPRNGEPDTRVQDIEQAHAEAIEEGRDRWLFVSHPRVIREHHNEPMTRIADREQAHAEALTMCKHCGARGHTADELAAVRRIPTIHTADGTPVTIDHEVQFDTDASTEVPVVKLRVGTGVAYLTLEQADELIEHLHDQMDKLTVRDTLAGPR